MKLRNKKSGQGMVEFALTLPVLLMIMLGLIEFGRLMFIYSVVTSASRDASRYGASIGPGPNGKPRYRECEAIRGRALSLGRLVGVLPGDVYITYDNGPGPTPGPGTPTPEVINCPLEVFLGDRIIVEVRGDYNPLPAAPLVGLVSFEFTSISRRTIIKDAPIQQAGTAVGAIATDTPTITPTLDLTTTATPSPTVTITNTPSGGTATPTFTPTPVPPAPPLFVNVDWVPFGNKCNNLILTWGTNPAWSSYPGGPPAFYQTLKNGFDDDLAASSDPSNTVWVTDDQINDNSIISYGVYGVFAGPLQGEKMSITFLCQNGNLIDISTIPDVNIEIVVPGIDGVTITNKSQTRFEAFAWDTTVGLSNGDGIERVDFEIVGPGGLIVVTQPEYIASYCAFDGNGPCNDWDDDNGAAIDFWNAPDGEYTIYARALSDSGVYTPWVSLTFIVAKAPFVEFVVPGVDGVTITDLSQTRFEIEAWNFADGPNNGDGIQDTFYEIIGPGGIVILSGVNEAHLRYCVFKGHEPCDVWDNEASISFADAPDGVYTIFAQALSDSGVYSELISLTFILAKDSTPTPTATP